MTASKNKEEQESSSTTASASKDVADNLKKRSKKKKKHVSKHVLQAKTLAKERAATESVDSAAVITESNNNKSKKRKKRATTNDVVKDPEDASNYLKAWQAKQGWKFNKNTQSWLLRHMYETEKVSKSTFEILLEYMKGLQGKDAKSRLLDEATARAQRYREYEKKKEEKEEKVEDAKEEKTETESTDKNVDEAASTSPTTDNDSYGLEHWKTLDDHEKRKEYKRARRVLEVLTIGP